MRIKGWLSNWDATLNTLAQMPARTMHVRTDAVLVAMQVDAATFADGSALPGGWVLCIRDMPGAYVRAAEVPEGFDCIFDTAELYAPQHRGADVTEAIERESVKNGKANEEGNRLQPGEESNGVDEKKRRKVQKG